LLLNIQGSVRLDVAALVRLRDVYSSGGGLLCVG